jgi:hypothetical protein
MLWKHFKGLRLENEMLTLRGSLLSHIFPNGAKQSAFMSDIVRKASVATRNVLVSTAAFTVVQNTHEGRNLILSNAGVATTVTLPAATGSGAIYRFTVGAVNTSGYVIKVPVGTNLFKGTVLNTKQDGTGVMRGFTNGATDDTITLNGTTTGGAFVGDYIEIQDIAALTWATSGSVTATGVVASPFSDTVA